MNLFENQFNQFLEDMEQLDQQMSLENEDITLEDFLYLETVSRYDQDILEADYLINELNLNI